MLETSGRLAAPACGVLVDSLCKRFGAVHALDGVDLTVHAGELVALLGPNGAGKSTLLRILGTTILPDSGTARVNGFDVVSQATQARHSQGVVLGDERSWYWRLTGRQNLEFFACLHRLPRRQARERATQLLADVELSDVADRRFDGYSSGMRARLSVARALISRPPVLLLDEPTKTLDPYSALQIRNLLERIAAEGRCILLVTHSLQEASSIAHRVLIMANGRIVDQAVGRRDPLFLEQLVLRHAKPSGS